MEHRDGRAYSVILGTAHAQDPVLERSSHAAQLQRLKAQINKRHPTLAVETLLMDLDGPVEAIPV